MKNVRVHRIAEQIKKELGQILQRELKDPRIGFVTITGVEVTGDLQQAKIYLSIMGNEETKRLTMDALLKAKGFIRSEIGRRISMRHTPELLFQVDQSLDYGNRIDHLLKQITDDTGKEE